MYYGTEYSGDMEILNEAVTKTNIDGIGNVEIIIKGLEGKNAHCHVYKSGAFHSCPKLYEASYFVHTGKEDKFNKKQAKDFNSIMKSMFNETVTVWEACCKLYDQRNNYNLFDEFIKKGGTMPDYTKLK